MKTTYDINKNGKNRVFVSTLNSRGKTRVSVVEGQEARNYKDGVVLYQNEFSDWRRIPDTELVKINKAAEGNNA